MSRQSIYEFTDPTRYVQAEFELAQKTNPGWSVRAWARRLKQRNPAMLAGVLKGQRRLTADWVEKLSNDLKLEATERRYFHLLVKAQQARLPTERKLFEELLFEMRKTSQDRVFPLDQFKIISDWYHLTILELSQIPGFEPEASWIQSRLRSKVEIEHLQQALDRLKRMGLLKVDPRGRVTRFSSERVLVDPGTRADAIRKFHTQMLDQVVDSIEGVENEERFLQGSAVALGRSGYGELCRMIAQFQKKACKLAAPEQRAEVYFLGTQLIPLTQGEGK